MCVVAVKPSGIDLPIESRLRDMFTANPDGAGFMYARNNKVFIRKGFMKFKKLLKAIEMEELKKADVVVFHFRIATSGSVSPMNTHPFPLSSNIQQLRALASESDIGIAHNGILHQFKADTRLDLSDTMTFIRDILADPPIQKALFEPSIYSLIEMSVGSNKFVFLRKDKTFALIGDWYKDSEINNDGLFYSNLYFRWRSQYAEAWDATKEEKKREEAKIAHILENRKQITDGKTKSPPNSDDRPPIIAPKKAEVSDEADIKTRIFIDRGGHIVNLTEHTTTLFKDETKCPCCTYPIDSNAWWCTKCGIIFEREDF